MVSVFQLLFRSVEMSQSQSSKRVSGKAYDTPNVFSLFYFPSDNTWETIGLGHSSWGSYPRDERPFVSIGELVSLKINGVPCTGVLVTKADCEDNMKRKKEVLSAKMDAGSFKPTTSFLNELNKSASSSSKASPVLAGNQDGNETEKAPTFVTPSEHEQAPINGCSSDSSSESDHEQVVETPFETAGVSDSFVALQKETLSVLKRINTSLERRRREDRRMRYLLAKYLGNIQPVPSSSPVTQAEIRSSEELVCPDTGENLLDMVGSSASKFACNLARKLFSEDDLINGMLEPQRDSPRQQLDRTKIDLIKSCVLKRFPNDDWNAVREAVNQLGRDLKRKRKMKPSPLVDEDINKKGRDEN